MKVTGKLDKSFSSTGSVGYSVEHVISEIKKWDPNDNIMFAGHTGPVWSVTSTSDNSYIFSGSEDKNIIVWDGLSNSESNKLLGHTGTVNVLEITHDDKFLISGCWNGLLMLWDWRRGEKIGDFVGHTAGIYTSRVLKDGNTLLTGSGDYSAKMWNISERTLLRTFNCEGNSVFALTLVKNESGLICGGWGGVIRIWESISSDTKTKDINPNAGVVQSLASSPDSKYVVAGTRNNIIIVYNYPEMTERIRHLCHNNWVRNLVTSDDSKYFLSASADKSVRLFNFELNLECFKFDRDDGYVFGLHLSKDNTILYTGASDKILRKRVIGIKNKVELLKNHTKCIMCLSISSDSRFAVTGSEDTLIKVWDLQGLKEVKSFAGHSGTVWGVNLTASSKFIISGSSDKNVKIWNFDDGKEVASFGIHNNPVFSVASTVDEQFAASGGQDKNINLFSLGTLAHVHTFEGHTDTVFSVRFSPDGLTLISGAADYTIRIWNVERRMIQEKIDSKHGMIESIALTRDMKSMAVGDRGSIVSLWNFENRKIKKKFTVHTKWVKSVAMNSDDTLLASASNDSKIFTINLAERKVQDCFSGHTGTIRACGFTPDGKYLVSAGEDLLVRLWDLKDQTMLKVNQYGSQFDTFLFLNCIFSDSAPTLAYCDQTITPLRLSLCHIYCYEGSHELLKSALEEGSMLKKDSTGNSPLFYALERNSQNCIDVILLHLNEMHSSQIDLFLEHCWTLRTDFERLLKNRSIHLPEFLENIFHISLQTGLAKFGIPLRRLPLLVYKPDLQINVNEFLRSGVLDKSQELLVEFRVLPFPIPMVSGSTSSMQMLRNIAECPNRLINRSSIILILVKSRWNNFWLFILGLTFVYWGNLICMIILLVEGTGDNRKLIVFALINLALFGYEMIQLFAVGFRDYMNFWNVIDLIRIVICFVWILIDVTIGEGEVLWVSYIMVIFNFLRGLTGFRAFDKTRFYVKLIIRAFIDTIPFIIIFFYTTLFFGMLYWTSGTSYRNDVFVDVWKTAFEANMGNFINSDKADLNFLYFMFTSVINVIIILNLLISILGDSYERFQTEAVEIGNLEMVELILEIETLMFWRRDLNVRCFPQVCDATRFEGLSEEWEGKLKAITDLIKKNGKVSKNYFDHIKKKLDLIEKKLK